LRFTLGKMFLAVAFLAIAFTGMLYRTRWWGHGIFTFTIAMYVVCAIWAFSLRGRTLAAAIAFSLAGGAYLLFFSSAVGRDALLTNDPIALMARALSLPGAASYGQNNWAASNPQGSTANLEWSMENITNRAWPWPPPLLYGELHAFMIIGHCVFSWLFAVVGAWFAGRMYDRRKPPGA
jgi:hypothetical protein